MCKYNRTSKQGWEPYSGDGTQPWAAVDTCLGQSLPMLLSHMRVQTCTWTRGGRGKGEEPRASYSLDSAGAARAPDRLRSSPGPAMQEPAASEGARPPHQAAFPHLPSLSNGASPGFGGHMQVPPRAWCMMVIAKCLVTSVASMSSIKRAALTGQLFSPRDAPMSPGLSFEVSPLWISVLHQVFHRNIHRTSGCSVCRGDPQRTGLRVRREEPRAEISLP